MAVYRVYVGELQDLMVTTQDGTPIVDTSDLTEQMQQIMSEYKALRRG